MYLDHFWNGLDPSPMASSSSRTWRPEEPTKAWAVQCGAGRWRLQWQLCRKSTPKVWKIGLAGSRWFQMVPGSRLNLNCWIEEPRWWCGPVPSIPNTVIQISRSYSITSIYIRTVQLLNRPLWIFWQHFGRVNLWAANCQHSKSCCCQWPLMLVCKMNNETYIPSGNLT